VYGHISGTHVNPAVTLGLALNGTIKWAQALIYWIAQFLGAILAGFLVKTFFGTLSGGETTGSLTTSAPLLAWAVEIVLTFFLVNTVLHAAVAGKAGPFAGWAIGTTLAFAILAGGPLTGASLNPARTFGPALFTGAWANPSTYLIYFLGPFIGATLAVLSYRLLSDSEDVPAQPTAKKVAARRK
jgi:glycerol uptake facilitator-like aquaporin